MQQHRNNDLIFTYEGLYESEDRNNETLSARVLERLPYDDLVLLTRTENHAISLAQKLYLLPKSMICRCGVDTSLRFRRIKKANFRCNERSCRKEVSIRKNTFFENYHLSISIILRFLHKFVKNETSLENLCLHLQIESDYISIDWLSFCREICEEHFLLSPIIVGGPGHIVEIDECQLLTRKHNIGRVVRNCWLLGDMTLQLVSVINTI
ncbi:hypothetical protein H312_01245 [Anncaliia algerae PRA339]|uniref:Uncharacterized protein n=1 Tax=Anncaliia algerae PRA339 TaxID=1288291 RepID=A0A059F2X9_9MICR|nr:hypothetical protein H312_01245 [Anncaliia algerae PRA339]